MSKCATSRYVGVLGQRVRCAGRLLTLAVVSTWCVLPNDSLALPPERAQLVRWLVPPEPGVAGYRIYLEIDAPTAALSQLDPIDVGFRSPDPFGVAQLVLHGLDPTATYTVQMTAYNYSGLESQRSNSITLDPVCAGSCIDSDEDGVLDDGDGSGSEGDRPCATDLANAPCDDNCPYRANRDQSDTGGIGGPMPDGNGDACQCGDVSGNGTVNLMDVALYNVWLAASRSVAPTRDFDASKCGTGHSPRCGLADAGRINAALSSGNAKKVKQRCEAARP